MALFSCLSTLLFDLPAVRKLVSFSFWERKGNRWMLARETAPLCVYLFLAAAMTTVPKLILEKQCGEEILGAYSSIFAPALLIQAAMGYIYNPFAQQLGELRQNGDRHAFLRLSGKITAAIAVITALMMVVAHFLGEWALMLIFGEQIQPYIFLLIPILIAVAVTAFLSFLCMLATVLRSFSWLLFACGAGVLIELFGTPVWIGGVGINGTSYSCILASAVACVILTIHILYKLLYQNKKGEHNES